MSFHFKILSPEITAPLFDSPRNISLTLFEVAQTVQILTRSASEANKFRLPFRVKCLPRWRFGLVFFAVVSLPVTTASQKSATSKLTLRAAKMHGFHQNRRCPTNLRIDHAQRLRSHHAFFETAAQLWKGSRTQLVSKTHQSG